jgi:voltage-gated potassium channel
MISAARELHQRIRALRVFPLLAGCTHKELVRVDRLGTPVEVPPHTTLMGEGEIGRECLLVEYGIAVVARGDRRIGTIGTGLLAGELALLDRRKRSATVVANTPMRLRVLTAGEFSELLRIAPCIERSIREIAAERRVRREMPTVVTSHDLRLESVIPSA